MARHGFKSCNPYFNLKQKGIKNGRGNASNKRRHKDSSCVREIRSKRFVDIEIDGNKHSRTRRQRERKDREIGTKERERERERWTHRKTESVRCRYKDKEIGMGR